MADGVGGLGGGGRGPQDLLDRQSEVPSEGGDVLVFDAHVDHAAAVGRDLHSDPAVERGATVREKPATFVTGDRFASIYDPFGHRWAVMTKVEDVSPEDAERRLAEWGAQQG